MIEKDFGTKNLEVEEIVDGGWYFDKRLTVVGGGYTLNGPINLQVKLRYAGSWTVIIGPAYPFEDGIQRRPRKGLRILREMLQCGICPVDTHSPSA